MILYRYEIQYGNYEEENDIILRTFPVIKETECFYFIDNPKPTAGNKPKRVSKITGHTYAHATLKEARERFIIRTEERVRWYRYWIEECEKALKLIEDKKYDHKN